MRQKDHFILPLYPRTRRSGHGSENARSAASDAPSLRPAARRWIRPQRLHALRHRGGFFAGLWKAASRLAEKSSTRELVLKQWSKRASAWWNVENAELPLAGGSVAVSIQATHIRGQVLFLSC